MKDLLYSLPLFVPILVLGFWDGWNAHSFTRHGIILGALSGVITFGFVAALQVINELADRLHELRRDLLDAVGSIEELESDLQRLKR